MTTELTDEELIGSDFKFYQIKPGKIDFATDRNGDFIKVSGKEYMEQRILHILLVRSRYYPPQIPELIKNDEVLKQNVDESGNHFYPGDLEDLGYPDYGSILSYLIGEPDTPELRVLMGLFTANALAFEYQFGLEKIRNITITKPQEGFYDFQISGSLIDNRNVDTEQRLGVTQ